MSLPPEIKKLARRALIVENSQVPVHRVLDLLASSGGDVGRVLATYRGMREPDLRRALHHCAELMRAVQDEAGLTPEWEKGLQGGPIAAPAASGGGDGLASATPGKAATAAGNPPLSGDSAPVKSAARGDDLRPFVDESARGKVRVAKAYTDGASKGNPGQAGIGVVIFTMEGKKIAQQAKAIGIATNNIAEYSALIEAMEMAKDLGIQVLNVISDSELMVRQVSGVYKVKNVDILKKVQEVMALRRSFEKFTINYVGREHNKIADALSTSLLKKPSSRGSGRPAGAGSRAANADDGYRDLLGEVDPHADEGATE